MNKKKRLNIKFYELYNGILQPGRYLIGNKIRSWQP